MRAWSEGRKDSSGNYVITPGWSHVPSDELFEDDIISDEFDRRIAKAVSNWMGGPVMGWLNETKIEFITPSKASHYKSLITNNIYEHSLYSNIEEAKLGKLPLPKEEYPYTIICSEGKENFPISFDLLRELAFYVEFTDLIDFSTAKTKVFPVLLENKGETVWEIMVRLNLLERADSSEVEKIVDEVIAKYPDKVAEYKAGKVGLLSLFMGDVMKLGKGKIKPVEATEMLKKKLIN